MQFPLLKKVFWSSKRRWQIFGASVGVFIGLLLLLFALQVYLDMQQLMNGAGDSNFLVLNKAVESMGDRGFKKEDLDTISKQPFFNDIGVFESNEYEVYAKISQIGLETFLFFQSVPAHFLDVDSSKFKWQKGDKVIPLVMSSDFLTLYNFGFAPSQGLPKFSKDVFKTIELDIFIRGNNKHEKFKAYIHDFSNNVSSILVPQEFMAYANEKFGHSKKGKAKHPNQVIVSTDNPYHKKLEKFLKDRKYEISRGGLIGGELKSALYLLLALVLLIGIIIIGLSLLVFVLNFQLLIEQSSQDIQRLMQIGYRDRHISQRLSNRLIAIFVGIVSLALIILCVLKYSLSYNLVEIGFHIGLWVNLWVLIVALLFSIFFIWINKTVIRTSVRKLA